MWEYGRDASLIPPMQYIYHGIVVLAGDPYQEVQKGKDGLPRTVWVFPLKPLDESEPIPERILDKNLEEKERIAKRLPTDKLKELVQQNQSEKVNSRAVTSNTFIRDAFVAEYAKRRANGICQLCNQPAPFSNREGSPYLECHHIEWISKGGSDTIDNTAALCPNCHRKMHVWNLESDREKLLKWAVER